MDGSKRSSHGNAYFAGIGGAKRIVLFDTLIEKLNENEIEAVLAHEVGHYKCGHIPSRLLISALMSFGFFFFLGLFIDEQLFFLSFGISIETTNLIENSGFCQPHSLLCFFTSCLTHYFLCVPLPLFCQESMSLKPTVTLPRMQRQAN